MHWFAGTFPVPPVLILAHYSHLHCAMLRTTMLRDVPEQFYSWVMFKHFCQKFGKCYVRGFEELLNPKDAKSPCIMIDVLATLYTMGVLSSPIWHWGATPFHHAPSNAPLQTLPDYRPGLMWLFAVSQQRIWL